MKKRFVGGIMEEGNKILLVKRAVSDVDMGGLWSLPAGGIKEGENPKEALIREFKEETNLEIDVLSELFVLERATWKVLIFKVSKIRGKLQPGETDIEELKFFEFDKLPQTLVAEGYLCILNYLINEKKIKEHFSTVIDKVFTSIFYSYLFPEFQKFDFSKESALYKYIIISTPYRKFKSVVPFLFSKCSKEQFYLFIIPELSYAIWTLLDDCHDGNIYRYGTKTALGKYGVKLSIISLFKADHNLNKLLRNKISKENIENITNSLIQSATILYQRGANKISTSIDSYLNQSVTRTEFLRISWKAALEEVGMDQYKVDFVYKIQKKSSEVGQLINDYFDITREDLEDFDEKVASSHWLLLNSKIKNDDRKILENLWKSKNKKQGKERYRHLLKKYKIKNYLYEMIRQKLINIVNIVQNSELDDEEKLILTAWHQMSYIQFNPEIKGENILPDFLESINRILYDY